LAPIEAFHERGQQDRPQSRTLGSFGEAVIANCRVRVSRLFANPRFSAHHRQAAALVRLSRAAMSS
jgi:hypothetical protein